VKRLYIWLVLLMSCAAFAADMPYDEAADARADVKHALIDAMANHKPVLLIFGANWCEDCRALSTALKVPDTAKLMDAQFNIVKINVGRWDKNLDLDTVYGNPTKAGIPAAVLLAPDQQVLYATRAGELADARSMSDQGVYDFFKKIVDTTATTTAGATTH